MHQYKGKMILHTGSMFSGKTSSLWKDLNRFEIAKYKTVVFKPKLDNRYADKEIVTHDNNKMKAIAVETIYEIVEYMKMSKATVIGIDEVQFIKGEIKDIVKILDTFLENGFTIVVAGLDMDFKSEPFEIVKEIMPRVDYLYKHHAVCANCGADAWVSYRKTQEGERIKLGAAESYEPLCRRCFYEKESEKKKMENQLEIKL
ncbi:MAG: thymidine kinase [Peptoniphilaceae bacterium]|uniref:thymidine kinase n=1 Tax=Parvimonas sp. TaxID=1944660 RepID=UPI002A755C0C|nr:thymidine kinase [Parvimonas sp.]MDD7764315.1 thymidine kinase [Peptoniphilaceae bacterium]MDY3050014.1 thymidine kinase [Parvimonas sp.]